jgi:hypothetical protein
LGKLQTNELGRLARLVDVDANNPIVTHTITPMIIFMMRSFTRANMLEYRARYIATASFAIAQHYH